MDYALHEQTEGTTSAGSSGNTFWGSLRTFSLVITTGKQEVHLPNNWILTMYGKTCKLSIYIYTHPIPPKNRYHQFTPGQYFKSINILKF